MATAREPVPRSTRLSSKLTSPAANTVLAVLGLIVPALAWAIGRTWAKDALLVLETVLVVAMAGHMAWVRRAYIQLRRADARNMSDAVYFNAIRTELEAELLDDFDEIADGNLYLYAADVPRISVMLYRILMETGVEPRRVLATDLTTDPRILGQRREYLAINKRLIDGGGIIRRVFICRLADLARRSFAIDLLELISHHRSIGVQCGIAVREALRPDQIVDFIVIGLAAVQVEAEQGDEVYRIGRSSVSFKFVQKWAAKFDSVWDPVETDSASARLRRYESAARAMIENGSWRPSVIRGCVDYQPEEV
jgi:hypothetical protein